VLGGCVLAKSRLADDVSPFDGSTRDLWVVAIKPFSAPVIRSDQIADLAGRKLRPTKMWLDVKSLSPLSEETETVYCVTNTATGSFTLANGLITGNCFLFRAEDSREGWSELHYKVEMATMSGGGIGSDYSDIREKGSIVQRTGGVASGPVSLARSINEMAREVLNGGNRRAALWGGLSWWHKDIYDWLNAKNHSPELKALKERDFTFPLPLEFTNISVIYDKDFFTAYEDEAHPKHAWARDVWAKNCLQAFSTADVGLYNHMRDWYRKAQRLENDADKTLAGTAWDQGYSDGRGI
jgi:hypothetical protein